MRSKDLTAELRLLLLQRFGIPRIDESEREPDDEAEVVVPQSAPGGVDRAAPRR